LRGNSQALISTQIHWERCNLCLKRTRLHGSERALDFIHFPVDVVLIFLQIINLFLDIGSAITQLIVSLQKLLFLFFRSCPVWIESDSVRIKPDSDWFDCFELSGVY
jgi:hypothetical protein